MSKQIRMIIDTWRRREKVPWRKSGAGLMFASPWMVGYAFLFLVPLVMAILISCMEWNGISISNARWVGLDNYRQALADKTLYKALGNTFFYSFISVPLHLCIALGLALLLNRKIRTMPIFRTIFYLPCFIAGVATVVLWMWMLHPELGMINSMIRSFYGFLADIGIESARSWALPGWLTEATWSKPALILMGTWSGGGAMLIFLAALQNMPKQLYEAASIDGAGMLRQFRYVTLPMLTPTILFNLVMGIIGSMQVFMQAYLMTGGGPDKSTLFYMLYLFQTAFEDFNLGYGSALAWILFAIIMVFTAMIFWSSKKWAHYE